MEVEKKGGGSFPSNYVTIHQLRQRWLQQQQSSSSLSLSPVISESNHRDDDDDVESSKKPQNDAVSGRSPPPAVTKTPSNKASSSSSNPNQQPPLSPISSSGGGGSKKKPQNDAVSPPPAKTKSPPSYNNNNNNNKPPPQQNHHNEIVSKTPLNETRFRKGCNPNRLLTPQKPEPEPEPTDNVVVNDVTDQPISIDNNKNQLSKKIKYKKTRNPKRVLPDQTLTGAGSLPQTDPKPELEAVVDKEQESRELLGGRRKSNKKKAVRESKMAPELEQVVVVEKKQQLRESRGRRDWDKKGVREFKDKTASSGQNKHAVVVVGDNVVEPELEVEMEVEAVVVEKRQKPRETRGRRDWDNKAVREFKPKTASFGQYDYNSNVDTNDDVGGGGGGVEAVDKVVGDGDVVKENSRRGSGKFDHQGQGQRQGKQSLKAVSFDHDQDMSETAVKESDAVNNKNNYYNINATSDGGSNWSRGSGRFSGQGIRRPWYSKSKPLIAVWVKKGESTTPN